MPSRSYTTSPSGPSTICATTPGAVAPRIAWRLELQQGRAEGPGRRRSPTSPSACPTYPAFRRPAPDRGRASATHGVAESRSSRSPISPSCGSSASASWGHPSGRVLFGNRATPSAELWFLTARDTQALAVADRSCSSRSAHPRQDAARRARIPHRSELVTLGTHHGLPNAPSAPLGRDRLLPADVQQALLAVAARRPVCGPLSRTLRAGYALAACGGRYRPGRE